MSTHTQKQELAFDFDAIWNATLASITPVGGSLANTGVAWQIATDYLLPRKIEESNTLSNPPSQVVEAVSALHELGMIQDLLDWHKEQTTIAFKSIISQEIEDYRADINVLLIRLATYLQLWLKPQQALVDGLPSTSTTSPLLSFRKMFLTSLHELLFDTDIIPKLRDVFQSTLPNQQVEDEDSGTSSIQTLQAIHYLGLLERFDSLLWDVIYSQIDSRISQACAGDFTTPTQLQSLLEWLDSELGEWLLGIYTVAIQSLDEAAARAKALKILKPAMQRFEWYIYSSLFKLRISELFDLIVEFPDSTPAVQDLALCLSKNEQKNTLIKNLMRQIRKRLLHPGADTRDIITQYINLIRVMRLLDPPGILLAKVAQPMRAYLRARPDTIRCIVQGMVEEDGDLMNELRGGPDNENEEVKQLKEKVDDEVEDFTDDGYKWTPTPFDAPADYSRNKTADIIQLLVSIYDTKELFVKELQTLLAQRLLAIKDYAFERELRSVEILKMRFGEAALAGLEVMLKDCADSKRIDGSLHGATLSAPIHGLVVSHLFWPKFRKQPLKLPGQLGRLTKQYEQSFAKWKPEKRLEWVPTLGSVTLEITLQDRVIEVEVTPLQAAVLETFDQKASQSVSELCRTLRMRDIIQIKAALQFWQAQGVLGQLQNAADNADEVKWSLLEVLPTQGLAADVPIPSDVRRARYDSLDSATPPLLTNKHASMDVDPQEAFDAIQPYWGFIQNALANLHSLPSARLHSMMTTLAPGYAGRTLPELESFLEVARSEGLLVKGKDAFWRIAAL